MKKKNFSILFILFLFAACPKIELKVACEPEKPLQGEEVVLKLSRNFSGYIWWAELSGGDPYKLIPHVKKIENEKEIKIKPEDKNTSLILFTLENKKGKIRIDSNYYILYYTEDKKPAPFALSMLGFFYFSIGAPFENLTKFSYLWMKEKEYYEKHYDFMDNKFYFEIQTGKETIEEVKRKIKEKLEEEKDNPSFLHASFLTANWVLKDTALAEEILKYFENLPEDKYKIKAYISYLRDKKGIEEVASYLKEKKIDYFIKDLRTYTIFKFVYPLPEIDKLIEYIKEREREGVLMPLEFGTLKNLLYKNKEWEKFKTLIDMEKEIINNPIKFRKYLLFNRFPEKVKNVFEEIKEEKNDLYLDLSSFYFENNKFDSSYFYIKKALKEKKLEEIEPYLLEFFTKIALKAKKTKEAIKSLSLLAYYYGYPEYEDTLKTILGKDYEKKINKIKKEIISKLKKVSDFEITLIDGSKFRYEENKGKIIVLNFWATWCGPCKIEIPELNELVEKFKDNKDVIFLAITDEDEKTLQNFLKKQEFLYEKAIKGSEVRRKFKVNAFPTHFIVDKKGRIVFKQIGYLPGTGKRLENKIEELLRS